MPGRDRSNDPQFLAAPDEWLTRINDPRAAPAHQRHGHGHPGPDRERVLRRLGAGPRLHDAPGGQGARRRHHRAADRQQQRHVQHRGRRARRSTARTPTRRASTARTRRVARRAGHLLRPPGRPAAVHAGVPGRLVRPVGRPRLRQVPAAHRAGLRIRLLQAEHRCRRHVAELLHDLRRHVVGLAVGPEPGLHVLRLRRLDHRGAPARPRSTTRTS